jgi:hypothetical protein
VEPHRRTPSTGKSTTGKQLPNGGKERLLQLPKKAGSRLQRASNSLPSGTRAQWSVQPGRGEVKGTSSATQAQGGRESSGARARQQHMASSNLPSGTMSSEERPTRQGEQPPATRCSGRGGKRRRVPRVMQMQMETRGRGV